MATKSLSIRVASFLLASLVSAPVLAAFPDEYGGVDPCQWLNPPKAFQREPNVPYIIAYTTSPNVMCKGNALACSGTYGPNKWVIWIDADNDKRTQACDILHEKAHLPPNYWSPGHRGRLPGWNDWKGGKGWHPKPPRR